MFGKAGKILTAGVIGAAAMLAATPAYAGYYVTYWSDYVGGTNVGGVYYCNGGNELHSWGVREGVMHYDNDPSGPC